MILFTILALMLLILLVVSVVVISVAGAGTLIIFGDVFVCIFIIGWIIWLLFFKKKK